MIHLDPDRSSLSPPLPIRKLIWVDVSCITCCFGSYFERASELGQLGQGSGGGKRQLRLPSKLVLSGVGVRQRLTAGSSGGKPVSLLWLQTQTISPDLFLWTASGQSCLPGCGRKGLHYWESLTLLVV